jgi:hypothetical protein
MTKYKYIFLALVLNLLLAQSCLYRTHYDLGPEPSKVRDEEYKSPLDIAGRCKGKVAELETDDAIFHFWHSERVTVVCAK